MLAQLSRNWWLFSLRGVAAILFGILIILWPNTTRTFLILIFGAYALAHGFLAVYHALTANAGERWWWDLIEGLVSIAVALLTFILPGVTAISLVYMIAAWAILTGILEILVANEFRREISNEWLPMLSGIVSVFFGVLVFLFPSAGALGAIWLITVYAVILGVLLLALSLRIRSLRNLPSNQKG